MNRQHSLLLTLFVLLGAALLASAASHQVSIMASGYNPANLSVNLGDSVTWYNNDSATHTVTASDGQFDSGDIGPGYTFVYVFPVVGNHSYYDRHNYYLTGVVVVNNSGGGSSYWSQQTSPTHQALHDVRFWDENTGWAAGDEGILRTVNRGETWALAPTSDPIAAVHFASPSVGWACGHNGHLMYTANGGESWQNQNSGVDQDLSDIWFSDAMHGWAVGRNGVIIHTANGGQSWSPQSNPASDDLHGIYMLDAQHGWIAGSGGLVLYTASGGADWTTQLQLSGTDEVSLNAVYALDQQHVWAAGSQKSIVESQNGGQTWTSQSGGSGQNLMDIYFPALNDGWVAGAGGTLGRWDSTTQGWTTSPAPAIVDFNSIYFVNDDLGFLVGGDGSIYKYDLLATGVTPRNQAEIPDRPELLGNYPNPFNPSTNIEFQLNNAGPVQLAVLNILGQRIGTLIDGPMNAGLHQVEFSGSNFPSGLYFYQLRAGGQTITRRMTLLK